MQLTLGLSSVTLNTVYCELQPRCRHCLDVLGFSVPGLTQGRESRVTFFKILEFWLFSKAEKYRKNARALLYSQVWDKGLLWIVGNS